LVGFAVREAVAVGWGVGVWLGGAKVGLIVMVRVGDAVGSGSALQAANDRSVTTSAQQTSQRVLDDDTGTPPTVPGCRAL
jgi:hypothetical protein